VVAGWFAGSNTSGAAARRTLAGGLETIGTAVSDGPVSGAGRWVAVNARWLRVAIGVLGALVLLWGNDVSLSRLLWSLVLVVALLAIVQILIGAGGGTGVLTPRPPRDAKAATATTAETRDAVVEAERP
jgi:hypothetical protein